MRTARRIFVLLAALATLSATASAYYYFVFFPSNAAPYAPRMGRFDLAALSDNAVQFFISDQAPGPLLPGDNTTAVYSEIRHAAQVWNEVPTSALRLRFGGITPTGLPQGVPGIDVVFDDDMPPGILAQTKPTFPADLSFLIPQSSVAAPALVPMLRARVQIRRDLTAAGYAQFSYSDAFFTMLVHEFGHALGLQHTLTSSVMSTAVTRATTKGVPLAADDVAGISLLYPIPGYLAATGSLTGQVARSGVGVNMASVVALSAKGAAISSLTNPDGTYRIDGLPPGQYRVYAHPLPPAQLGEGKPANIIPPLDPQNDDFSANIGFGTQFFPGTRDWTQATVFTVTAGTSIDKVNFVVDTRTGPAVYGMQTYGYQDSIAIASPPLPAAKRNGIVFYAPGTTVNQLTAIAPGLDVSVIGDAAQVEAGSLRYYTQGFLQMVLATAAVTENVPTALAVTLNNDLYVLPVAFTVVPNAPPSITAVTTDMALGLRLTSVLGTNLGAGTRIVFDGAPATVLSANSDGSLSIAPPEGLSGHQAAVEALNPDGQTSLQALGSAAPPVYPYPFQDAASVAAIPGTLTAGTDTWVAISGVNTHFANGQTVAGFGSSDISVRRSWVVNPQLLWLNVTVSPLAQVGVTNLTVSTGLEIVTAPGVVKVAAADPKQISLRVPVLNAVTGLAGVPAGGTAYIRTSGLPAILDGWTLSIGGRVTPFQAAKDGVLIAPVPGDLTPGPQVVQLLAPGTPPATVVPPVLLQLDVAPPVILAAVDSTAGDGKGVPIGDGTPAILGDTVTLTVLGLSAPLEGFPTAGAVWINVNGAAAYGASAVIAVPQDPNNPQDLALVQFVLPKDLPLDPNVTAPKVTVMVGTGTRLSAGFTFAVAATPAAP